MSRYPSLLENLRHFGVPVIEIEGWRTRGSSSFHPIGGVNHHTAGPVRGIVPSLGTCINGRPDVPGPLCNVLLGRDNVARLITDGRANHAGRGGTRGMVGNSSCFGLEVEHTGVRATEEVLAATVDMAARIQAAFARTAGYDADMAVQHWEWTSRKIDFVKGTVDATAFRALVAQYLRWDGPHAPDETPAPNPENPSEEDDMASARDDILAAIDRAKPMVVTITKDGSGMKKGENWVVSGSGRWRLGNGPEQGKVVAALAFCGQVQLPGGKPGLVNPEQIALVPIIDNALADNTRT